MRITLPQRPKIELGIHETSRRHRIVYGLLTMQEKQLLYGKNGITEEQYNDLFLRQHTQKWGATIDGEYYEYRRGQYLEVSKDRCSHADLRLTEDDIRQTIIEIVTQTEQLTLF